MSKKTSIALPGECRRCKKDQCPLSCLYLDMRRKATGHKELTIDPFAVPGDAEREMVQNY